MTRYLTITLFALLLTFGGFGALSSTAQADCGSCEAKQKVCAKCKKAGKTSCHCHSHKAKVCTKCKKAGKKVCGCKHK